MIWTRILQIILLWPWRESRNLVRRHCRNFTQRHSVRKVWARLGEGERIYNPDKWSPTVRLTERRTDRLTTLGCPQSRDLIKLKNILLFIVSIYLSWWDCNTLLIIFRLQRYNVISYQNKLMFWSIFVLIRFLDFVRLLFFLKCKSQLPMAIKYIKLFFLIHRSFNIV